MGCVINGKPCITGLMKIIIQALYDNFHLMSSDTTDTVWNTSYSILV